MKLIATCKLGLEALVARELTALGSPPDTVADARIDFEGDDAQLFAALLWLRCAERVFIEAGSFEARTFDQLFEGVKAIPWRRYLPRDANIHVTGKSAKSALLSVSDCQSITKKAIVDNLKQAYRTNTLPETGDKVIVEVGLLRDRATLALDCCGAGLARRGYRTYNVAAPLSETLGAAIVLLSRYRRDLPLVDPMCGAGTMPIEAAMIARNQAPGMHRSFAAERYAFLDLAAMARERERARDAVEDAALDILGLDLDPRCIDLCKKHAKKAGVMLQWGVADVRDLPPREGRGIVVCNPPYGERMLDRRAAADLYRQMRRALDRRPGWSRHIITGHPRFEREYGARADKRRKLSNGGMVCTLYQYFAK